MKRMLYSLGKEIDPTLSEPELQIMAEKFDMSIVEQQFEEEVKRPLRNLVMGELARIVLVNMQRLKVDMLQAMEETDAILKHQQLNFYIMATVPMFIIFGVSIWYLRRLLPSSAPQIAIARANIIQNIREAERILNRSEGHYDGNNRTAVLSSEDYGFLLLHLSKIEKELSNIPEHLFEGASGFDVLRSFKDDLAEIESDKFSHVQKLRTIERMWRTYKLLSAK